MQFSMAIKTSEASIRVLKEEPRVKVDALEFIILDKVKRFNRKYFPKASLCLARSYKIANENKKKQIIKQIFSLIKSLERGTIKGKKGLLIITNTQESDLQ